MYSFSPVTSVDSATVKFLFCEVTGIVKTEPEINTLKRTEGDF